MAGKSLAAQTGAAVAETPKELQLPAIFQEPQDDVKARQLAPYITFAHQNKADEWAKIGRTFNPPVKEEMYFVSSDYVVHLPVAKMALMRCKQYWYRADAAGKVLGTSLKELPDPYKEAIEAVVLVYFEDRVVPANVQMRTTKCPAGKIMFDTLAECQTPEWAAKSAAHKETLVCKQPFMRFFAEVSVGPPRTSKSSGLTYRPTQANPKPTGISEWRLMKGFQDDPESQKMLDDAAKFYKWRLDQVAALIGK